MATDLSSLTADQLAEKVERGLTWRRSGNLAQFDVEGDAALTELVRRLKAAEDALEAAESDLRDEAFIAASNSNALNITAVVLIADRLREARSPDPNHTT